MFSAPESIGFEALGIRQSSMLGPDENSGDF